MCLFWWHVVTLQGISAKDSNNDTYERRWKACRGGSCQCGLYNLATYQCCTIFSSTADCNLRQLLSGPWYSKIKMPSIWYMKLYYIICLANYSFTVLGSWVLAFRTLVFSGTYLRFHMGTCHWAWCDGWCNILLFFLPSLINYSICQTLALVWHSGTQWVRDHDMWPLLK